MAVNKNTTSAEQDAEAKSPSKELGVVDLEKQLDPIEEDKVADGLSPASAWSTPSSAFMDEKTEKKEAWFKGITIGTVILVAVILSIVVLARR